MNKYLQQKIKESIAKKLPDRDISPLIINNSPDDISFTTTAMARPDILQQTYESFATNLNGLTLKDKHLYINIDPIPNKSNEENIILQNKCIEVAKSYFGHVTSNVTDYGNFAVALKWVWVQIKTPYVFHLEDDWELIHKIEFEQFCSKLQNCHQVCLRAYDTQRPTDNNYLISFSPSLWKSKYCKLMAELLPVNKNPETFIRTLTKEDPKFRFSNNTAIAFPDYIVLKDIGREWMRHNGCKKLKGDEFIRWTNTN